MNWIKRLRAKSLGDPKVTEALAVKDIKPLGVIFGIATGTKEQKDRSDETQVSHLLVGFFEGQTVDGGETLRSDTLALPGQAQTALVAHVNRAGDGKAVSFAVMVGTRHAENASGYEYVIDVTGKPETFDLLDTIRAVVKKIDAKKIDAKK